MPGGNIGADHRRLSRSILLLIKNQILLNLVIMQMSYRFPTFLADQNNSANSKGYVIKPENIPPISTMVVFVFYTLVLQFNINDVLHNTCFFV
jgi:hypothetical protein